MAKFINQKEAVASGPAVSSVGNFEEILAEIEERKDRASNIILFNVAESDETIITEKQKHDKVAVENLTGPIIGGTDDKIKRILRIGKAGSKPRPIKLILKDSNTALNILRKKHSINNTQIRISSDMTIKQRDYLKELRAELDKRRQEGEPNLTIRYIHGIPKIILNKDNIKKN